MNIPELVLHNGKIIALDRSSRIAEAVSVTNGRIATVGASEAVLKDIPPTAHTIDLKGKTVIPGLFDAARLGVTGESCGGNLSAAYALKARDRNGPHVSIQVLIYPMLGTDFEADSYRGNTDAPVLSRDESVYFWENYLDHDAARRDPLAVPLVASDFSNLPPAYIVTAEYDPLRDDGVLYSEKLAEAETPVELYNPSISLMAS